MHESFAAAIQVIPQWNFIKNRPGLLIMTIHVYGTLMIHVCVGYRIYHTYLGQYVRISGRILAVENGIVAFYLLSEPFIKLFRGIQH